MGDDVTEAIGPIADRYRQKKTTPEMIAAFRREVAESLDGLVAHKKIREYSLGTKDTEENIAASGIYVLTVVVDGDINYEWNVGDPVF